MISNTEAREEKGKGNWSKRICDCKEEAVQEKIKR
jgi:hypothetical protein